MDDGGDGRRISRELVYCFALFVICTSSGGVILGNGPFSEKFNKEHQLLYRDELNVVFNVGAIAELAFVRPGSELGLCLAHG